MNYLKIALPGVALALMGQAPPADTAPVASTRQGPVIGATDGNVVRFLGIPYAQPPVGALRWKPPVPITVARTEPLHAVAFGPSCPQQLHDKPMMAWTSEYLTPANSEVSENCLSLNVWSTPEALASKRGTRPVLVFIHGGGYTEGGSSISIYDGANLARRGMVVVTLNYRLGPLGFLAHRALSAEQGGGSGNYAIQDQIAALQWVRDNVAAFGGDPAKVTVAGQSAGAWSVMALLAAPPAKGLFRAAIAMSTPDLGDYRPLEEGEARGAQWFANWKVGSLAAARALPTDQLTGGTPWKNLVADGKIIPKDASATKLASDVPMMMGYMLNDLFAPTAKFTVQGWADEAKARYGAQAARFVKYYPGATDAQASRSAAREAGDRFEFAPVAAWVGARNAKSPVYVYRFSHVEPGPGADQYGAFHTADVPYMFDTLGASPERPFTEVDRRLVRQFSGAIEAFVKTGNPNEGGTLGTAAWQPMTPQGMELMEFGDEAAASRIFPAGSDDVIRAGRAPARQGEK